MQKVYPIGKNTTIFVAKPDAIIRGLTERIKLELKQNGFYILVEKRKHLMVNEVKSLYQNNFRRDFPKGENDDRAEKHINYYRSAPMHAYLLSHKYISRPQLFETTKKVRGNNWLPIRCNRESIRYKLRNIDFDNYLPHFSDGFLFTPIPENVVHAVLSEDELQITFSIFFKDIVRESKYKNILPEATSPDGSLDILLVVTYNNSSSDKMEVKTHNGVSHLFSFLKEKGFSVRIIAFAGIKPKDIAYEIVKINPRVVGLSTVSSEFSQVAKISDFLSELIPYTTLIGGGTHFTINPHDIYATSLVLCNI